MSKYKNVHFLFQDQGLKILMGPLTPQISLNHQQKLKEKSHITYPYSFIYEEKGKKHFLLFREFK